MTLKTSKGGLRVELKAIRMTPGHSGLGFCLRPTCPLILEVGREAAVVLVVDMFEARYLTRKEPMVIPEPLLVQGN